MLKKKKWLNRWKKRMLKSGEFDRYFIITRTSIAILDMKDGLSPEESADIATEVMKELKHANKSGS